MKIQLNTRSISKIKRACNLTIEKWTKIYFRYLKLGPVCYNRRVKKTKEKQRTTDNVWIENNILDTIEKERLRLAEHAWRRQ